ncbi:olfactory receptor 6N1-like [Limanda limanda]|uniref:olfactory receptor 6N1-like n=1 Tax=Limanda limanda TaxID=27771 RepID=UPI0029C8C51C|nr:olfactory receptor 6N1-like [Limanda limanda]
MENHTNPPYFNLTMFVNLGSYRYPTFVLCFLLYAFIVAANLVIILAISQEKKLHEPMYIFIMCLSINSMYGSAGFFLRFLRDLLSDTHMISRSACFTQVYIIYSYASYELTILGIMAYDRYVAVCQPLHYHNKITLMVMSKLIVLAWIYPSICVAVCLYLSSTLPLCGNMIPKVFCANWPVVKLSCVATLINNLVGMLFTSCAILLPLAFVLFTYVRIFLVCRKRSLKFQGKVLQSCVPHIVTFVSYSITMFCDISLSRINVEELNPFLGVILSLEVVVIPPILNPLVYGLKLPEIRKTISRMLSCSKHDKKAKF